MANRSDSSKDEREESSAKRFAARAEDRDQTTLLRCPSCSKPVRMGELVCPHCGADLNDRGALRTHYITGEPLPPRTWTAGEVVVAERKPIVLEINGERLSLPLADVVTLGRRYDNAPAGQPHVDLSRFGAEECGVSRLHARLRRKGILVYVADMGSLNGTHLNGRRLIPDGERLLRDNDELYLSRLRIRVHFS